MSEHTHHEHSQLTSLPRLLRASGQKVTPQRLAILSTLMRTEGHVTAGNLRGESKGVRNPRKGSRPVFFAEAGRFLDTPVYDHYALAPGVTVQGPAIVEQRESTVVVGPNATASLDENYNLIMLLG